MMEPIQYFEIENAPGRYFKCDKFSMTLADSRCAAMWREARAAEPEPGYRLAHCRGCAIGATHAGEPVESDNGYYGKHLCCRCHTWSSRIVHGSVCPSCYNREREVLRGCNAKGSAPHVSEWFWGEPEKALGKAKTAKLHQVPLSYRGNGGVRTRRLTVVNTLEAVLSVLRQERGDVVFSRTVPDTVRGIRQLPLFGLA